MSANVMLEELTGNDDLVGRTPCAPRATATCEPTMARPTRTVLAALENGPRPASDFDKAALATCLNEKWATTISNNRIVLTVAGHTVLHADETNFNRIA